MGDHIAVDVALEGHESLLREYGALEDSTWVRGDRPVPGEDALVAVIIDDLLVATKAPRHTAPEALPRLDEPLISSPGLTLDTSREVCQGPPRRTKSGSLLWWQVELRLRDDAG